MKLSALNDLRESSSATASGLVRNLALAGLATVWLFAGPFFQGQQATKPADALYTAGALLVGGLVVDVLQFYAKSTIVQFHFWAAQRTADRVTPAGDPLDDYDVEDLGGALTWVTGVLFYCKGLLVAAGFVALLSYFAALG